MTSNITNSSSLQSEAAETAIHLFEDWFDPIEAGLRERVREFIQAMIETELEAALCRRAMAAAPRRKKSMAMGQVASPATGMATDRAR